MSNAPSGAKLDAWIDFNGDGSWGGPFEQIADDGSGRQRQQHDDLRRAQLGGGRHDDRPVSPEHGGNLGVRGGGDGEVEDYQSRSARPQRPAGVFGNPNVISTAADRACSVFAADVDGDGDMDVLSASFGDDKIAWYENDGSQDFTDRGSSPPPPIGPYSVFAADVDGDGDLDVLSASATRRQDRLVRERRQPELHGRTRSPPRPTGPTRVFAADVDGDGDIDVLSASFDDDKIAWYENDGSQVFTRARSPPPPMGPVACSRRTWTGTATSTCSPRLERRQDRLVRERRQPGLHAAARSPPPPTGRRRCLRRTWTGTATSTCSRRRGMTTRSPGTRTTAAQVFTRAHHLHRRRWRPSRCLRRTWTGTATSTCSPRRYADDKIAWYENDGSQNFTAHTITTTADGARSVFAADVDGDGDLDVLSRVANDDKIAWYENLNLLDGDFNDDGVYDCLDINALTTAVATGGSVALYDLNGDNVLSLADVDAWRAEAGEVNLGPGRVYLVGDANLDSVVDGTDFGRWNAAKFTNNTNWCDGNFNADLVVDGSDFGLWNATNSPVPTPWCS